MYIHVHVVLVTITTIRNVCMYSTVCVYWALVCMYMYMYQGIICFRI